jgi:CDP-diacylglycerol--glycerol-3-phosphate 3-phosphatidyltransferase
VVAFCLGAVLTEFAGILGQALGARRHYEGPMGKSDRAFVLGAMGLLTAFLPRFLDWWPIAIWAAAALTLLTCGNRLGAALRELKEPARP